MFSSFRRLLKRSKDREVPQTIANDSYGDATTNINPENNAANAYAALTLLQRPRPGLAAEISRLRRQHRELQRRFEKLPPGRPHIRRAKLLAALGKMTASSRSVALPGRNLGRPLTSIDPASLAARGAQRIRATKIPSYNASLNAKAVQKSASLEAETSLGDWHAKGAATSPPFGTTDKAAVAPFKQAASAHRMRRLREWSLTHGQDQISGPVEGDAEQDFAEAALAKIQHEEKKSTTTTTGLNNNNKAWSIMAGLSLETIDKNRGASAVEATTTLAGVSNTTAAAAAVAHMPSDGGNDRRKTEPLNASQHLSRKPSR